MARYIRTAEAASLVSEKYNVPLYELCDDFAEMPSVDVERVVRCKDCTFYETVEYDKGFKYVCRLLKRQMDEYDFCSYGKRKGIPGAVEQSHIFNRFMRQE